MQLHHNPSRDAVKRLLSDNRLPVADIDQLDLACFIALTPEASDDPAGIVGLQIAGTDALLRSLVVDAKHRGAGHGHTLVSAIEQFAQQQQITRLYLLTETAETFFQQHGYRTIQRSDAPDPIAATTEFSALCPDSATAMCKKLPDTTGTNAS
jgi:amino-acid N-acetyltransferase